VVKHWATTALVAWMAVGGAAEARDNTRAHGSRATRTTQPHTRTTERQRTETGRTRSDTVTRADGATASRHAVVTKDTDAGTRTRNVDYTGFDGKERSVDHVGTRTESGYTRETNYSAADGRTGSKSDVIQRTEDGYSRNTTHTTPDGATHTRDVDVSCDKDAKKCVKQVDVGQQP